MQRLKEGVTGAKIDTPVDVVPILATGLVHLTFDAAVIPRLVRPHPRPALVAYGQ